MSEYIRGLGSSKAKQLLKNLKKLIKANNYNAQ